MAKDILAWERESVYIKLEVRKALTVHEVESWDFFYAIIWKEAVLWK
jgi:hypothetical protein